MSNPQESDAVMLGGGEAGKILAWTLSETRDFMNALIETDGDRILGASRTG
jgi:hypothetical protein